MCAYPWSNLLKSVRRLDVLIVLFLLLLPLLWFAPQVLGGKTLLPADNLFASEPWKSFAAEQGVGVPHNLLISDLILENRPWKSLIVEALRTGSLTDILWNPRNFAGVPFLAAGQHSRALPAQRHLLRPAALARLRHLHLAATGSGRGGHVPVRPRPAAAPRTRDPGGDRLRLLRFLPRQRGLHNDRRRGRLAAADPGGDRDRGTQTGRKGRRRLLAGAVHRPGRGLPGSASPRRSRRDHVLHADGHGFLCRLAADRAGASPKTVAPPASTGRLAGADGHPGAGARRGTAHPPVRVGPAELPRGCGQPPTGTRLGLALAPDHHLPAARLLRQSHRAQLLRHLAARLGPGDAERPGRPAEHHRLGREELRRRRQLPGAADVAAGRRGRGRCAVAEMATGRFAGSRGAGEWGSRGGDNRSRRPPVLLRLDSAAASRCSSSWRCSRCSSLSARRSMRCSTLCCPATANSTRRFAGCSPTR